MAFDDGVVFDEAAASELANLYLKITTDLRVCETPALCGNAFAADPAPPGYFLERLDGAPMRCFDGELRPRCRTAGIDWSASGLPPELRLQMLQAMEKGAAAPGVVAIASGHWIPIAPNIRYAPGGVFVLVEAWVAEANSRSAGGFVRIQDNGIVCVAAPCPHLTEESLYDGSSTAIDELDFSVSALREQQIARVVTATFTADGAIVAGERYELWDNGHAGLGRTVTAAYRRLGAGRCDIGRKC